LGPRRENSWRPWLFANDGAEELRWKQRRAELVTAQVDFVLVESRRLPYTAASLEDELAAGPGNQALRRVMEAGAEKRLACMAGFS